MFGKIIPLDMLARMPLPFVHRLRDIRIKQLQEANRQQELQLQQTRMRQTNNMRRSTQYTTRNNQFNRSVDPAMFNGTPFDDIIDELT